MKKINCYILINLIIYLGIFSVSFLIVLKIFLLLFKLFYIFV